jgi:hypothetical protein
VPAVDQPGISTHSIQGENMINDDPQEIVSSVAESVAATEVVTDEISAAPAEVEEVVAVTSETSEESAVEIVAEEAAAEAE